VGNTFGNAADFASLLGDVETKLFGRLPDDTWFYPGHGKDSTIGAERPHLAQWRARGVVIRASRDGAPDGAGGVRAAAPATGDRVSIRALNATDITLRERKFTFGRSGEACRRRD
jgi:hypothetical protein